MADDFNYSTQIVPKSRSKKKKKKKRASYGARSDFKCGFNDDVPRHFASRKISLKRLTPGEQFNELC